MTEQRKDRRAPAVLRVKYKSPSVDRFIAQFGTDISRGGIFIRTKKPLPLGAPLKLELQLHDASQLIHGVGRVTWRREAAAGVGAPAGMGVKFLKLDPDSRALVERAVQERAAGAESRFEQTAGADMEAPGPSERPPPPAPRAPAPPPPAMPVPAAGLFGAPPTQSSSAPPGDPQRTSFFPDAPAPSAGVRQHDQARHSGQFLATALSEGGAAEDTTAQARAEAERAKQAAAAGPLDGIDDLLDQAFDDIANQPSAAPPPMAGGLPAPPAAPPPPPAPAAPSPPPVSAVEAETVDDVFASLNSSPPPAAASLPEPPAPPAVPAAPSSDVAQSMDDLFASLSEEEGLTPPDAPIAAGLPAPPTAPATPSMPSAAVAESMHEVMSSFGDDPPAPVESDPPVGAAETVDDVFASLNPSPPADDPLADSVEDVFASLNEESGAAAPIPDDDGAVAPGLGGDGAAPQQARLDSFVPQEADFDFGGEADVGAAAGGAVYDADLRDEPYEDDEYEDDEYEDDEYEDDEYEDEEPRDEFGEFDLAGGASIPAPAGEPERKKAPILPIAIGVLAVAGGLGAWLFVGNQPPPPPPNRATPVATPGSDPQAQADPGAVDDPDAPPDDPGTAPPTALTGEQVRVNFTSLPRGADLWIGGEKVSATPTTLELPAGVPVKVTVSSTGYRSMSKDVMPMDGILPQRFKLEPLPFRLVVKTDPLGAEVSVGKVSALSPEALELGHITGQIAVSIVMDGYRKMTRPVLLDEFTQRGDVMEAEISVSLSPLPGTHVPEWKRAIDPRPQKRKSRKGRN